MATRKRRPIKFGVTIFEFRGVPKTLPWSDMFGQERSHTNHLGAQAEELLNMEPTSLF